MAIFKRLLTAAIGGALGLVIGSFLGIPFIAIGISILGIVTGWNIPSKATNKIISETEKSLQGKKRYPMKTVLLWLIMFAVFALALINLGQFLN